MKVRAPVFGLIRSRSPGRKLPAPKHAGARRASRRIARMLKIMALSLVVAGAAGLALSQPAEARSDRAKVKKAHPTHHVRRTRIAQRDGGWEARPAGPALRDRTTFYHPNGRLNGQEFFDSISDRTTGAGE